MRFVKADHGASQCAVSLCVAEIYLKKTTSMKVASWGAAETRQQRIYDTKLKLAPTEGGELNSQCAGWPLQTSSYSEQVPILLLYRTVALA
jgi:hypothetical protein